jgi:uncharacterized protein
MNSHFIEFSVKNFMSFKDKVTFSLLADTITENKSNIFTIDSNLSLLKTSILYGANASGKTNLLESLKFFKKNILTSTNLEAPSTISVQKFLLSSDSEKKPSFFEIVLSIEEKKYKYNFSIKDNHDILKENLFEILKTTEKLLFSRENDDIDSKNFKEGQSFKKNVLPHSLFLSLVAQLRGPLSTKIIDFFRNFNIIDGTDSSGYAGFTRLKLDQEDEKSKSKENKDFYQQVIKMMRAADFGISDIVIMREDIHTKNLPFQIKVNQKKLNKINEINFYAIHEKFNKSKEKIDNIGFDIKHESKGTQRIFDLSGPLIDTLQNGKTLFIDELNASLHPFLCQFIIDLFHSKYNKNNAQIVFTTHDSNLLSYEGLRRDQFWFVEKNKYGASELFSLSEFKERNDTTNFEKRYLQGRYGAVPFVNSSVFEK